MNRDKKIVKELAGKLNFKENQIGYLCIQHAIEKQRKEFKQSASVEKIEEIMYKTEDDYELGETNSLHIAIAKEIHKLIGK